MKTFSSASILDPRVSLAQVCNQGKRFAIEELLLGDSESSLPYT
jgi:hypothetical protein